jgi:hypothetical protein
MPVDGTAERGLSLPGSGSQLDSHPQQLEFSFKSACSVDTWQGARLGLWSVRTRHIRWTAELTKAGSPDGNRSGIALSPVTPGEDDISRITAETRLHS